MRNAPFACQSSAARLSLTVCAVIPASESCCEEWACLSKTLLVEDFRCVHGAHVTLKLFQVFVTENHPRNVVDHDVGRDRGFDLETDVGVSVALVWTHPVVKPCGRR